MDLITDNNEKAYLEEVEGLTSWCMDKTPLLDISKTKELMVDFAVNMWNLKKANGVIILLCASLAISLIVIALLIYSIKKKTRDCNAAASLHGQMLQQANSSDQRSQQETLRGHQTYTVVQWPTVSDSVRPGDLMTLQCSVLSDSENKTCPGDHNVYWFKTGSDKSHPNIIYTDGNRHDECDKRSDTQKSCIYRFSKNVSSSDAGTYYCAVATCGEILFGRWN
ncbi:hypothetical protein L3Q82_020372 [Scortum barcoo]|uniref:Uncharacterized protein n=1 Tax=Scortum barcoo TaxID=214431 RepID=A0ACB8V9C0_9TELE|nr:hypothetical protein L3Q82_020372 [Scortum barcoo]